MKRKTLVVGSSPKPNRYSFRAMTLLAENDEDAVGYGLRQTDAAPYPIYNTWDAILEKGPYHTLTMYMSAENQLPLEEKLLALKPERIIFNPGAENNSLAEKARQLGIETEFACTLVMLRTGQY